MGDVRHAMAAGHGISSLNCLAVQLRNAVKYYLSDREALDDAMLELAAQAERDIVRMKAYIDGPPADAQAALDAINARFAREQAEQRNAGNPPAMEITFADASEAMAWLKARNDYVKWLARQSKPALIQLMVSGHSLNTQRQLAAWSKDELVSSLTEAGYPPEARTLAGHIRVQAAGVQCSDACPHHDDVVSREPMGTSEWPAGKAFGELTDAQRHVAVKNAADQLQRELSDITSREPMGIAEVADWTHTPGNGTDIWDAPGVRVIRAGLSYAIYTGSDASGFTLQTRVNSGRENALLKASSFITHQTFSEHSAASAAAVEQASK